VKIYLDCIPCFLRQSLDAGRNITERLRQTSGEHVVPGLAGAVFRFGVASALVSRETP